jgi:uncharacterized repeat protein (TIGR01451 family)
MNKKLSFLSIITCGLIVISLFLSSVNFTGHPSISTVSAAPGENWFDPAWNFRRNVTVSCPCSAAQGEYQVKIVLDGTFSFSNARSDGADIRITDSDGITPIPFWIESWNPSTSATIWVKMPAIPLAGTSIYIYYGNLNPASNLVEMPPIGPWTRAIGNPIIPEGATGTSLLAENIVYDSATSKYWMALANYSQSSIALVSSTNPTNAADWTWEGNVIFPTSMFSGAPHLIKQNETWYLFYADFPNIRVATSLTVGGPYSNNKTILTPSATWETYRVDEPYIFQRNDGKWVLIYMGDAGSTSEQIGFAIADTIDGPYTKSSLNPVLAFGPAGSYDAGTVADPWVVEFHGTYYIGYTVSPTKLSPWQTAYATTTDWITFTKHGIIFPKAASGWDSNNAFRGAVTRIGDTYVLSYTGDSYQMGIATQPVYAAVNQEANVFPFFDEFTGSSYDSSKWVIDYGSSSQLGVSGGWLTLTANSDASYIKIHGNAAFGMDYLVEGYGRDRQGGTSQKIPEIGFVNGNDLGTITRLVADFHTPFNHWEYQARGTLDSWTDMEITADTAWHQLRVYRLSPNVAGFQIDSITAQATTTQVPTGALNPFLMSYGSGNLFDIDWIRVRKYCGANAVATVGTEEPRPQLGHIKITMTGDSPILSGDMVDFSITVTNNGDYDLNDISVSDALAPDCDRLITSLVISQSENYTCSQTNVTQDFTNSVTASGTPTTGAPVSSSASFFVDVLHPGISIDLTPASQTIFQGDPVTFSITVTNSGDTSLSGIAVTDTDVSDCNRTIGTLTAGQSNSYTCSQTNITTDFFNSATVTSSGPLGSSPWATSTAAVTVTDLSQAAWMNTSWSYRRFYKVSCPCGHQVSDYQVKITLDNTFNFEGAKTDGSDIRVTGIDGTTQIPFWIEHWDRTNQLATIWVKLSQLPISGSAVFLYYGNANPPAQPLVETPPIGPWTRAAGNPIIPAGATGTSLLAENIVYDSATAKYWMALANYSQSSIALVSSTDPTNATAWIWEGNVIFPSVYFSGAPHLVHQGDLWYLFYADRPNLMVADSPNVGGPYTHNRIILSPTETWEAFRVDEPYVFQRNDGKWVLIYMADAGSTTEQVGFATADTIDGTYTKSSLNPVLAFGPTGSFDAGTIADPWVVEYYGTYYLGYTVSPTKSSPWQTAYATTTDWITFTKHGVTFPLAASGWDSVNAFRGAVIRIGNTYVLSYTGDGYQMGIATQPVFRRDPFNEPAAVFPFYDDFNDGSFDATKWYIDSGSSSQISETGGTLTLTASGQTLGQYVKIQGQTTFGMDYMVEGYASHPQWGALNMISEIGLVGSGTSGDKVRIADDFHNTVNWERQSTLSTTPDDPWTTMGIAADTAWHTFRVYRTSGTPNIAGFQIDNTLETTSFTVPISNLPPFLMSFGNTNQMVVDWIRVRRWCGSEPTLTAGNEQSHPTGVDLNYFRAYRAPGGMQLAWETVNEATLAGFNLYRRELDGKFEQINAELIAPEKGGEPVGYAYVYMDDTAALDQRYEYRLEVIETNLEPSASMLAAYWPYSLQLPMIRH